MPLAPLLLLDLRVNRFALRWFCPAWAIDETLRALALLLPWIAWLARRSGVAGRITAPRALHHALFAGPAGPPPWFTLHDALRRDPIPWRPPSGEPLVSIEVGDTIRLHLTTR
jgi:hypothetical protein